MVTLALNGLICDLSPLNEYVPLAVQQEVLQPQCDQAITRLTDRGFRVSFAMHRVGLLMVTLHSEGGTMRAREAAEQLCREDLVREVWMEVDGERANLKCK